MYDAGLREAEFLICEPMNILLGLGASYKLMELQQSVTARYLIARLVHYVKAAAMTETGITEVNARQWASVRILASICSAYS